MGLVQQNLKKLEERIQRACDNSGRSRDTVTLVAVTKTHSIETLKEAYECGLRNFGESRLQEALPKIALLPGDIQWHMIGKLQSNKARKAAQVFDWIHSLESETQLGEIDKECKQIRGLIQVNLAEEEQKSGIPVKILDNYIKSVRQCAYVRLEGLMTITPERADAKERRKLFTELAVLAKDKGLTHLSMGMSDDFEEAIACGATLIRVGSALFGTR